MFNACQLKTVVFNINIWRKTSSKTLHGFIRWILLQSWLVSAQYLADRPQNVTETAWWDHLKCSGLFQSLSAEVWLSSRHILLLPQPVRLDGGPVLTSCLFPDWVTDVAAIWCWETPSLTDCVRSEDIYTKSWSKLWQNLTWQDDVEVNCKTIFDFKRFVFLGCWIFSQLQEKKMVCNIITKGCQLRFSWGLHSTV